MVFPIGSFALGVMDTMSDIDLVIVAPPRVTREQDFFGELVSLLKNNTSQVTEILSLDKAYVPIIKLKYNGWPVDIQFANYSNIEDLGCFQEFPQHIEDSKSLLAINSILIVQRIKSLVSFKKFQILLRMVKLWATRRGIRSNTCGYLGGISWSIMVAQTCISFPNFEVNMLFTMFFTLFDLWKWPQPVIL